MALSAALHANFNAASPSHQPKLCFVRLDRMQKSFAVTTSRRRKGHTLWIIKSVLNDRKPSINDDEATEPARILLDRLFAQTQKLEEQISKDMGLPRDGEFDLNLGKLESDLQAALAALKKKEEDVEEAERKISLDYHELKEAKEELGRREEIILAACSKQERLEEELKQANLNLVSQAMEIEDLKLQLKDRDQKISAVQSALSLKEDEMEKMMNELMKTSVEAAKSESELRSKAQLLNEANEIVKKQELEIKELRVEIQGKEEALEVSMIMQKTEEEKLRAVEAKLEKQTVDWLVAQEDLKKLAKEASKYTGEANETLEDFRRVKKLLADVRSELVLSQKALSSSRQKMEDQQKLLEKQLIELEEQRRSVLSYMTSLRDARVEVESGRVKLRVAEARNKELERDLSMEKELLEELQKDLDRERLSLKQATEEMSFLQKELVRRETEFREAQDLLEVKESELVEARLEIQYLKSEQASLQLMLEDKDLELSNARNMLGKMNQEIAELRVLMNSRDNQLMQVNTMLKDKDEQVQTLWHDLNDTKLRFSEAESVVEQIVELSNNMVLSIKDGDYNALTPSNEKPEDNFKWQKKQLETELEIMRESLRSREMEVLAAQRALTIKETELNMVLGKLDEREKELKEMKEELTRDSEDLRKLYALAQERIGEKTVGDLAIEKLQLEAAQLEIEAATSALQKITDMSRELLDKASLSIQTDYDTAIYPLNGSEIGTSVANEEYLGEVKTEVARLSALTEKLLEEAGIVGDVH